MKRFPLSPLTLVFLSMRSGAARGRASSNRSWYGGTGLCLVSEGPLSSGAKQSGMEQGGGRSSDPAEAPPPSGVEVSIAWWDMVSPAGGPGEGSVLGTRGMKASPGAQRPLTATVVVVVVSHIALSSCLPLCDWPESGTFGTSKRLHDEEGETASFKIESSKW